MELVQSLSFFLLVLTTVFMARMIRHYVDGIRQAGELIMTVPRKRWNVDVIGSVLFALIGLNDTLFGDRLFGVIILVVAGWWLARGIRAYQFHANGIILEMEYFSWTELKSWTWSEDGKPEVVLHLAGKPSRSIRSTTGKDEMEALFRQRTDRTSEKTE